MGVNRGFKKGLGCCAIGDNSLGSVVASDVGSRAQLKNNGAI